MEQQAVRARALEKAARRLVPMVALLYFVSFLDRVNVGFAALAMNSDLGLSLSDFGFGAGIFFIGYIAFAVPSGLAMQRVGAARWMAITSIAWGLISAGTAFARTPIQFYLLRLLLGSVESGFFPAVIFYLSTWFPEGWLGRIVGAFFIAVPLSNVIGAPISGQLLSHGMFGFSGWQTMFAVAASGIYAACPVFWTVPSRELAGATAASSIALINSLGNLAGYVGPWLMGAARDATDGYDLGLTVLGIGMVGAAALASALRPAWSPSFAEERKR